MQPRPMSMRSSLTAHVVRVTFEAEWVFPQLYTDVCMSTWKTTDIKSYNILWYFLSSFSPLTSLSHLLLAFNCYAYKAFIVFENRFVLPIASALPGRKRLSCHFHIFARMERQYWKMPSDGWQNYYEYLRNVPAEPCAMDVFFQISISSFPPASRQPVNYLCINMNLFQHSSPPFFPNDFCENRKIKSFIQRSKVWEISQMVREILCDTSVFTFLFDIHEHGSS